MEIVRIISLSVPLFVFLSLFRSRLQYSNRRRVHHPDPVLLKPVQQHEEEGPWGRGAGEQTATGPTCRFPPSAATSAQGTEPSLHESSGTARDWRLSFVSCVLPPSGSWFDAVYLLVWAVIFILRPQLENISQNRRVVLCSASLQTNHGRDVWVLGKAEPENYDGMVTNQTGVVLAAPGADCMPILLADPRSKVIAVVHAGRRKMYSVNID